MTSEPHLHHRHESDVEVQKDEDGDNFRLCPVCDEELGVDFEGVLEK